MFKFVDRIFNVIIKVLKWVFVVAFLSGIAFLIGTISYMG